MENIAIYGFSAVLITMGICQIVKKFVANRYIPVVSLIVGIGLAVLGSWGYFTAEVIVKGLVIGLVASGLWSGTKATILNK